MANRQMKATELSGLTIYQGTKNGTVWYDIFTRQGFIMTSQEVPTYMVYSALLPVCLVLAVFAYNTFDIIDIKLAFVVGIVLYIAGLIGFRVFFFYHLPKAKNFVKPKANIINSLVEKYTALRLEILVLLCALAVVAGVVGIIIEDLNIYTLIAMAVMSIVALVFTVISAIAFIKKKKETK